MIRTGAQGPECKVVVPMSSGLAGLHMKVVLTDVPWEAQSLQGHQVLKVPASNKETRKHGYYIWIT